MTLNRHDPSGFHHPVPSEISPRAVYEQRREFLAHIAAGAALAGWAGREALAQTARPGKLPALAAGLEATARLTDDERATLATLLRKIYQ
jgi:sulfoxide reductase catalytic subunit YedY